MKRYLQGSTRLQRSYERAVKRRRTMAASIIQRAVRSRMSSKRPLSYVTRARNATGEDTISYPALASTVKSDGFVSRSSNDLIAINPLNVARKTTTDQDINTRETDVIYLSGFKVKFTASNISATNYLYFNIALVSCKPGVSTFSGADFFTSGGGTTRSYDFDNVNYTTLERNKDPINSDNFVVHWHERRVLSPNQQACAGPPTGLWPNMLCMDKYVPIQRQIRFDTSSASSSRPIFRLVCWTGIVGEGYNDPFVTTATQFATEHSITAYYREPPK